MSNRQARRAQARTRASNSSTSALDSANDIPLARPVTSKTNSKTKTLLELAAEREAELRLQNSSLFNSSSNPSTKSNASKSSSTSTSAPSISITQINPDGTLSPHPPISSSTTTTPKQKSRSLSHSSSSPSSSSSNPQNNQKEHQTPKIQSRNDNNDDQEVEPPSTPTWLDPLLLSITLTLIHSTLTLLVHHQYSSDPPTRPSSLTTYPPQPTPLRKTLRFLLSPSNLLPPLAIYTTLSFITHYTFLTAQKQYPRAVELIYFIASLALGIELVRVCNQDAYLAVMARAPGLGTLWVGCVVRMGVLGGVGSLLGVLGVSIWMGWGVM